MGGTKIPISVLVLVHTADLRVLLLERADYPGHWQSVTGSQEAGETLEQTALRELREETGIDAAQHGGLQDWKVANAFEIYLRWRDRYPEGITHNTEHAFSLRVPEPVQVTLDPREHLAYAWVPWRDAAQQCFSWTNRDVILLLPTRVSDSIPPPSSSTP